MNPEQLKALADQAGRKKRPERSVWIISSESRWSLPWGVLRLAEEAGGATPLEGQKQRAAATPGSNRVSAAPQAITAIPNASQAVLTVSGYIVNRERIELSPPLHRGGEMDWRPQGRSGCEGPGRGETG